MRRRKFLRNSAALAIVPAITGLYSWQLEPFWLDFVQISMPLKNLPKPLIGKTVMQISDMHVGNRFPRQHLIDSMKKAATFLPDYVVYTGDYVSYESKEQLSQLQEVMKSKVLGQLGSFAILGNHDYGENWSESQVADDIVDIFDREGIQVLRNQKVDCEGLNIIGLDDFWGTNFHPQEVLESADGNEGAIILCHNPDVADQPIWQEVSGWILSGHTHGGQVKPPFLDPPVLPVQNQHYTAGVFHLSNDLNMYINRALGHLWQVRFNVRPEITIFTLEQS